MENEPTRIMDGLGSGDMAIPEVKLIQNVGGAEARASGALPGDFYSNITGEITKGDKGFDMVVVDIRKQRTYWGRTEIEDEPPICASLDARVNMNGESCDQCPYEARTDTPWAFPAAERRNKCLPSYTILAIAKHSYLPMLIRAGGISTQAVRELLTALRLNKQLKGEYHRAIVHVTSQAKKTVSGDAFTLVLRPTELISDAKQIEELKGQSLQLLGVTLLPEMSEPEQLSAQVPKVDMETVLKDLGKHIGLLSPGEIAVQPSRESEKMPSSSPKVAPEPIDTDF